MVHNVQDVWKIVMSMGMKQGFSLEKQVNKTCPDKRANGKGELPGLTPTK